MSNFNALVIPIIKKPTAPPVGQIKVYFTPKKELMGLDSDDVETRIHLKKYSEQISLTESFNILNVKNEFAFEVEGDQTAKLVPGKIFVIDGSSNGTNDRLLTVQASAPSGENTDVIIEEGGLANDLDVDGEVHIERDVTVTHNIGTKAIAFSLSEFLTGEGEIRVNFNIQDNDNLILTPEVPIPGSYLITVVG